MNELTPLKYWLDFRETLFNDELLESKSLIEMGRIAFYMGMLAHKDLCDRIVLKYMDDNIAGGKALELVNDEIMEFIMTQRRE